MKNFPTTLSKKKYSLKEIFDSSLYSYDIAIYTDKEGNESIAKAYFGNKKTLKYSELSNEYNTYKILWNIIEKNEIEKLYPYVKIPRILSFKEDKETLLVLLEKIPGQELRKQDAKNYPTVLLKVEAYLQQLYALSTDHEKNELPQRNMQFFTLASPVLIILAFVKNPEMFNQIAYAAMGILKNYISLVKNKEKTFTHRDLNVSNVICNKKDIGIIDFQLLAVSYKSHDFANMYYSMWNNKDKEKFEDFLIQKIRDKENGKANIFMLFYAFLFDLALGTNKSSEEATDFLNYIRKIIRAKSIEPNNPTIYISTYDDITNPHYAGGGAIAIHEVAKRLSEEFALTVISWNHRGIKNEVIEGVTYKHVGFAKFPPKIAMAIFQMFLPFIMLFQKFDVWFESFGPPFTASGLPLFTKKHVVGITHMLAAEDMKRKYTIIPFEKIENIVLQPYKKIIVTSNYLKTKMQSKKVTGELKVISNGVEKVETTTNKRSNYFLYLGRIEVEQKGLELLLQAFKIFTKEDKQNYKLHIAGKGSEKDMKELTHIIEKLKLKNKIKVLGHVAGKKKHHEYTNAKAMVITSRFETFCMVALEAMASGLPVVCFDIEGLKWIPNDCAVKVKPFNVEVLAEKLAQLSNNNSLTKTLTIQGKKYAQNYTWDNIAMQYSNYIEEIVTK